MMIISTQKRKAVDQVNHDFSDFSLSSPATKIRRLDNAELAPIMEEDDQLVQEEHTIGIASAVGEVENEERAIVVFNPNNTILDPSPTFTLPPHILSRFKATPDLWSKRSILSNNSSADRTLDQEEDDYDDISNQSLAVVPWVASRLSPPPQTAPPLVQQLDASDTMMMMEDELESQQETTSMDIEQEFSNNGYAAVSGSTERSPGNDFGGPSVVGFHHWQQQHCMVPSQLPHNVAPAVAPPAPSPVVWFR